MIGMDRETWEAVVKTSQQANSAFNAVQSALHGTQRVLCIRNGDNVDSYRLPRVNARQVAVDTPTAFASAFAAMFGDGSKELVTVGRQKVQVERFTPPRFDVAAKADVKNCDGQRITLSMPVKPSANWNDLVKFLSSSQFDPRQAVALRAQLAAWLNDTTLKQWVDGFKKLRVTRSDQQTGIASGGIAVGVKTETKTIIESADDDPTYPPWFDSVTFSAKLYDWSENAVDVKALVSLEPKEGKEFVCRPLGNALVEAEIKARNELAEQLQKALPFAVVVLGDVNESQIVD